MTDIEQAFKQWNPKTRLKVVVFEENGGLHNLQRALGHATTLNATRRHGSFVLADSPANCLQPWKQNDNGWDQGQIFFTSDKVWGMPPFYAQQILSEDHQPLRVSSQATPGLDVVASRSSNGRQVVVTIVNLDSRSIHTSIELNEFQIGSASAQSLSGELDDTNSPSSPNRITTRKTPTSLYENQVDIILPAHSLTSLRVLSSTQPKSFK